MTFAVHLFKLSEDTKPIFLQPVGFTTDNEVLRRNFSPSELSFPMFNSMQQKVLNKSSCVHGKNPESSLQNRPKLSVPRTFIQPPPHEPVHADYIEFFLF
eukprot:GHVP01027622.1.p1 GENE.GHVP01027622.1~~GHVP01027622.1.p1  ORF type:complete len:100 (+),score=12.10 GHVP01027622.1:35-334(+)